MFNTAFHSSPNIPNGSIKHFLDESGNVCICLEGEVSLQLFRECISNALHLAKVSSTEDGLIPNLIFDFSQIKNMHRDNRNALVDFVCYNSFQFLPAIHFHCSPFFAQVLLLICRSFPTSTENFYISNLESDKGPIHPAEFFKQKQTQLEQMNPAEVQLDTQRLRLGLEKKLSDILQLLGESLWQDSPQSQRLEFEFDDPLAPLFASLNLVHDEFAETLSQLCQELEKRKNNELHQRTILNSVAIGIQIFQHDRPIFHNLSLANLLGIRYPIRDHEAVTEKLHGPDRDAFWNLIHGVPLYGAANAPIEVRIGKDLNSAQWFEVTASKIFFNGVFSVLVTFNNINDRKLAEKSIFKLAFADSLTGLPNRTVLADRIDRAIQLAKRHNQMLAVLFVDLDNFKLVNDSMGHQAGDKLLIEVARVLSSVVRTSDTVARYGGDEFVLLLPEITHSEQISVVLQKLQKAMAEPIFLQADTEIVVQSSIGVSVYPMDGENYASLLQHADIAMFQAKENGRNGYRFFHPSMNNNAAERLSTESALRKAIAEQQFILYYQPQIDLAAGRIIGFEALIRWLHPTRGMVPPFQFIQIAEDSGLIEEIGKWVILEACRQNKEWQDEGLPHVQVGVNISPRQFKRGKIYEHIRNVLEETGLSPEDLKVEITESAIMSDVESNIDVLKQIRDLGVSISIDDFGTGYSSLSYLKRFPVSILKIDQSFVRDMAIDHNDKDIVSTIIAMGEKLKLELVAEGVESLDQLELLHGMGCNTIQGYYFAKPMPADEAKAYLQNFDQATIAAYASTK